MLAAAPHVAWAAWAAAVATAERAQGADEAARPPSASFAVEGAVLRFHRRGALGGAAFPFCKRPPFTDHAAFRFRTL